MNLETNTTVVHKSQEYVFGFLTKVENYEQLMPENTNKFEAGDGQFVFALAGMPEIALKIKETQPNEKVVLGSMSEKFPFTLTGLIGLHP